MPRIRFIKPDFFLDEDLVNISPTARLMFIGLWTLADREGRLEDRPMKIKALLFPYEQIDSNAILEELNKGYISRYVVDEKDYIQINKFKDHQRPHKLEKESVIPKMLGLKSLKPNKNLKKDAKTPDSGFLILDSGLPVVAASQPPDQGPKVLKPLTPIQIIVRCFKVAKNIDPNNTDWDKKWFGRNAKPAQDLLIVFNGDSEKAGKYLLEKAEDWKDLPDWGIEAVIKAAGRDYNKLREDEDNDLKRSEMESDRVLGPGRPRQITRAGAIAKNVIGNILPSRSSDDNRNGNEV